MTITFTIIPNYEQDVLKLLHQLIHHASTNPHILEAHIYRSQKEPYNFFAYLQFTDQAALDAHEGNAYYGEYVMTNLYGMLAKDSPTIETYKSLFQHTRHEK
ncbi:putative quinol monooxygenase [Dictyobacter alpinus]|nr:antibiotic biosynthesis monooxygenase family protein [Dictyobacter alpinus]